MEFKRRLVDLADDPTVDTVIAVTSSDIAHGRAGSALIAPRSAYLVGDQRTWPDLPAVR
ncbi:hypothetical protein [Lentzea sp. CC55]|uniref:hypothetical protein n=1 Tax=Lentzea sp. CC55 TaxID=2884909 RepID=UPI001F3F09BC|nr:hypothetical protein [Lentzea sp. CC55]MCG8925145.1 hypothetical protein [Lentzea sp. CC55]